MIDGNTNTLSKMKSVTYFKILKNSLYSTKTDTKKLSKSVIHLLMRRHFMIKKWSNKCCNSTQPNITITMMILFSDKDNQGIKEFKITVSLKFLTKAHHHKTLHHRPQ